MDSILTGSTYFSSVTLTNSTSSQSPISELIDGDDDSGFVRLQSPRGLNASSPSTHQYAEPYPTLTFELVNPIDASALTISNDNGALNDGIENAIVTLYDFAGNVLGVENMTFANTLAQQTVSFPSGNSYSSISSFTMEIQSNFSGTGNFASQTDIREIGMFGTLSPVCFSSGMPIETVEGYIAVEDLEIGDLVRTFDNGYQPVRFVYGWRVAARGADRPIVFRAGTIGNDRDVVVSQEHKVLIDSVRADLLHPLLRLEGKLIKASLLVNGDDVYIDRDVEEATYYHIMFDRHELIYCHGSISESWQPKLRNLRRSHELRAALLAQFPEFESISGIDRRPVRNELCMWIEDGERRYGLTDNCRPSELV